MKMMNKCLYCYKVVETGADFHEKCSLDFFGLKNPPLLPYALNQMTDLAKNVVERSIAVPGVQPKLSMSIVKDKFEKTDERLTIVGALGGNYIFKPPNSDFVEMPENEHVTMRIAESFGIKVVQSSLVRLASGELSYITKRIDRAADGTKIHMIDMFQITEAFDKYKSSMEKVGNALHSYSENPILDKLFLFELTLFCYLTGNNDMHLKNFSMILTTSGWVLAPAYDLLNVAIVNPDDKEELALTIESKKNKLKLEDFIKFGTRLELNEKQIKGVFKRFLKNKQQAIDWIGKSFLSEMMKTNYIELLETRYSNFLE
jgi:serine/threonine-protein kinase HipA